MNVTLNRDAFLSAPADTVGQELSARLLERV